MKTRLILVGGFLGAGKTTLLGEAAREIGRQNLRVGLITNDQAAELVDTAFLQGIKGTVSEVSGSCFCCNFQGFADAVAYLQTDKKAEVIIAEPVGSCTDLSATILQPLKEHFGAELLIAPLSVLADGQRLSDILEGGTAGLHSSAAYIMAKQMDEADIIVISKTDLLSAYNVESLKKDAALKWPKATILAMSAQNGEGMEEWLAEVMNRQDAGTHLAAVDYDIYAEGEAVLGWLNATWELEGEDTDWRRLAGELLRSLSGRFSALKAAVGHVKLFIAKDEGFIIANLTGGADTLSVRGSLGAGGQVKLTLNARVETEPETLGAIVKEEVAKLGEAGIRMTPLAYRCLSPGRPDPTYRYDHIVK